MAQFVYNNFIKTNSAPNNADHISVYRLDNPNNDDAREKVGTIPLGTLNKRKVEEPIYKFGLLSDIHLDSTDYNYSQYINSYPYSDEGEGDFRRALTWLRDIEKVDLVCSCGDMSQNGTPDEFEMPQSVIANVLEPSFNIPFYTCTGNHDVKTAGGNGFGNYFLRNLETTWNGMSNFQRSSAFNESFCFDKIYSIDGVERVDHFIFFSMYSYSLGPSASPYVTDDITWLSGKLEEFQNDRTFVFTHLFFPDLAGNLGRINGSGGIYPTNNWLGGTQLATLTNLLNNYPNASWFSGHSHWKWDLQKYQNNITIAQNGNTNGAWTIHVPSCALPIDSDYSSTTSETERSREEKPLESQGAVVYVYKDNIVIRGIDFNINNSQNNAGTRGDESSNNVKYLPIAEYTLDTRVVERGEGESIEITSDDMYLNIGNSKNYQRIDIDTMVDGNDKIVSFTFKDNASSIIFHTNDMNSSTTKVRMECDEISVKVVNLTTGVETDIPSGDLTKIGWLSTYDRDAQTSVYDLSTTFDVTYGFLNGTAETYTCYQYDDYVANGANAYTHNNIYGVQFNTSSSFTTSNTGVLDQYGTFGTDYAIKVTIKNLIATPFSNAVEEGDVTYSLFDYNTLNNMEVDSSKEVIMLNPHRSNGYVIGHNGTSAVSLGNGFANTESFADPIKQASESDDYTMILAKKQETRIDNVETQIARNFEIVNVGSVTITEQASSISGWKLYRGTESKNGKRQINVSYDGNLPIDIYLKAYRSSNGTMTTTITGGNPTSVTSSTNNTLTSLSNFTKISMTSATMNISTQIGNTNGTYYVYILVPENPTDTIITPTEIPGDSYYTLSSKRGSYGPTGTTANASWSTNLMHYTLSNPSSLGSSTDLTSGVNASNNTNLIRFTNPSNYYLNAGGGISALKFAQGTGEWSIWYLVDKSSVTVESGGSGGTDPYANYLRKARFETNTNKGSLSVDDRVQDLSNGYVAVSFNGTAQGFWVTMPAGATTINVIDLKVYSGMNVTSGTPISLPANVGFYEGTNHSGTNRYQIVTGFAPSTTESGSNGRVQFQTSSSYDGGDITIVMKISFN